MMYQIFNTKRIPDNLSKNLIKKSSILLEILFKIDFFFQIIYLFQNQEFYWRIITIKYFLSFLAISIAK